MLHGGWHGPQTDEGRFMPLGDVASKILPSGDRQTSSRGYTGRELSGILIVSLLSTHQVRHDAPDATHGLSPVVHVEQIEPARPL